MRVLPTRRLTERRRDRGDHAPVRVPAVEAPSAEAPAAAPVATDHPHERRARESGGPIDRAQYHCGCGMVFDAPVSTSVSCPHCGGGQAW
jgi:hypothetical protein